MNAREAFGSVRPALLVLLVVAGCVLLWSRLMGLTQSMWGDEAYSVAHYVLPGPSAIWNSSTWVPNDQLLFEVLTWATVGILGVHTETVYRLWGVFPAIGAVALVAWWMWRRFDLWAAVVFVVLAAITPLFFSLGSQVRGYGIGFLAAAGVIVAGDAFVRSGRRADLVLCAAAGFLGIATLENFVAFFLAAAAVMMVKRGLRKPVALAVAAVAVLSLVWYAPLLSKILSYHNVATKGRLGPLGFVTAPFTDTFGAGVNALLGSVSVTVGAILCALLVLAGLAALLRSRERVLPGMLIATVLASYLLIEVAPNAGYAPRFASFVVVPLLIAATIALTAVRHNVVVALVALVAVLALGRFVTYAARYDKTPFEQAQVAGMLVTGDSSPALVLTNRVSPALKFYTAGRVHAPRSLATLEHVFCTDPRRIVFLDQQGYPHPPTTCLVNRGAFSIKLHEQRQPFSIWLAPALRAAVRSSSLQR